MRSLGSQSAADAVANAESHQPAEAQPQAARNRRGALGVLARSMAGVAVGASGLGLLARPAVAQPAVMRLLSVDNIVVVKHARVLSLRSGDKVMQEFRVALGRNDNGPKQYAGDGRTPEGLYFLDRFNPRSEFYKSIRISYPNAGDWARAAALGMKPGNNIMLHGLDPNIPPADRMQHWMFNWTQGCIAVTDGEIDVIWGSVRLGTPIEIRA